MISREYRFLVFLCSGLLLFIAVGKVQAQGNQPEFTIAPPPLAYPDYSEAGSTQGRVTGTLISIESEGFEVSGQGISVTARKVLDPSGDLGRGFGFAGGLFFLSGDGAGGLDLSGYQLSIQGNLEGELYKSDGSNLIAFGGLNFTDQYISADSAGAETDIYVTLFGFQAGGQMSFHSDSVVFSPFVMFQSSSGTATVDVYIPGGGFFSTDTDVDVSTTVYGFDLLHTESGITLSGVLQAASSDDSDTDVTLIQVSYAFGGSESAGTQAGAPRTRSVARVR